VSACAGRTAAEQRRERRGSGRAGAGAGVAPAPGRTGRGQQEEAKEISRELVLAGEASAERVLTQARVPVCAYMLNSVLIHTRELSTSAFSAVSLTLALLHWAEHSLPSPAPNVVCCTSAITTLGRFGDPDSALSVFERMLARGVQPNVQVYTALIWAFASAGRCNDVLSLRSRMEADGIGPNERTYNALISCCAKARRKVEAWDLLRHMRSVGLSPNVHCLVSLIDACAKAGDVSGASAAFDLIENSGFSINPHAVAALAKAYAISQDAGSLQKMLNRIQADELPADTAAMNAILDGFAETGKASLAAQAFGAMRWRGIEQDCISFNCLMRALIKKDKCADALAAWDFMYKQGVKCNFKTLSIVMAACLRSGRGAEAEQAYIAMVEEQNVQSDQLVRGQLVAALCLQGRTEDALREAELTKTWFDLRSRDRIVRAFVNADALDYATEVVSWSPSETSLAALRWLSSKLCMTKRQREAVDVLDAVLKAGDGRRQEVGSDAGEEAKTNAAASVVADIAATGDSWSIALAFSKLRYSDISVGPEMSNRVRELLLQSSG